MIEKKIVECIKILIFNNKIWIVNYSYYRSYGSNSNKSARKVAKLLDQLGLSSRAKHLPWKLSGGEKQRVAIARAIVNNPSFLFLDEPTGNLDDENSNLVQDLILQIANEHDIALILSTHDINFANKMNKVYKIDNRNIKEV